MEVEWLNEPLIREREEKKEKKRIGDERDRIATNISGLDA